MMINVKRTVTMIAAAAVFFVCGASTVCADSQYIDNDKVYSKEDEKTIYISSDKFLYNFDGDVAGVTVCGYAGSLTDIAIPEEINGRAVAAIDKDAFAGNKKITSLTVPSCIVDIGDGAFNGCTSLEKVTLSGGTQILDNVFCDCPKLKEIVFPYGISEINNSFRNCTALSRVKFSRGVSKLGDGSFNGCISIEKIEWSTGLYYLGDVFDGSTMLSKIHIPKGIVIIDGAFDDCSFAEVLELPDSLLYINSGFSGCTALRSVNLPDGLVYIGKAFGECTSLKDIKIPSGTNVAEDAFEGCNDIVIKKSGINAAWVVTIVIASLLFAACLIYTFIKAKISENTRNK
ncbi:MAG: leucine-rich repeat domain-containing protein [Acutalibacteraceae bacterium]